MNDKGYAADPWETQDDFFSEIASTGTVSQGHLNQMAETFPFARFMYDVTSPPKSATATTPTNQSFSSGKIYKHKQPIRTNTSTIDDPEATARSPADEHRKKKHQEVALAMAGVSLTTELRPGVGVFQIEGLGKLPPTNKFESGSGISSSPTLKARNKEIDAVLEGVCKAKLAIQRGTKRKMDSNEDHGSAAKRSAIYPIQGYPRLRFQEPYHPPPTITSQILPSTVIITDPIVVS